MSLDAAGWPITACRIRPGCAGAETQQGAADSPTTVITLVYTIDYVFLGTLPRVKTLGQRVTPDLRGVFNLKEG